MHKRKTVFLHVLSIFLYLVLAITIAVIGNRFSVIHFGTLTVEVGRFLSLLTVIQIFITVFLTIHFERSGYNSALILYFGHMLSAIVVMVRTSNLNNIPAIFMNVEGIVMITIIMKYRKRLNKIANTDALTNLNNRRSTIEYVENKIKRKKRFAFLLIDLDDFKKINDLLGHDQGDAFLCKFVHTWKKFTEEENIFFARIGGDEFVMVKETSMSKTELEKYVKKALIYDGSKRKNKHLVKDKEFSISASMGISLYPDDGTTFTDLFRYADIAMYSIKSSGKHGFSFFKQEFLNSVNDDFIVEQGIRSALNDNDFFVAFQPLFYAETLELKGAEALVRIKAKDGKIYFPSQFISVAEKSDLIIDIDFYVFKNALKNFVPFLQKNNKLILSVNFSVKTLFSDSLISKLKHYIQETSFPFENLQIEITESLMISPQGKKFATQRLIELHNLGIKLAIDDFGTGYSSLSYLKDLPFDTLKIDKAFVDSLSENEKDNAFVKAIITIGHLLQMEVVSEGVEKELQSNILQESKCDIFQGFLYGKPMPIEQFKDAFFKNN